MEVWSNGGMEYWRYGVMEVWRNGGMEEWRVVITENAYNSCNNNYLKMNYI